jgi:hypothetical protein
LPCIQRRVHRAKTEALQKEFREEHKRNNPLLHQTSRLVDLDEPNGERKNYKAPPMTTIKAIQSGERMEKAIADCKAAYITRSKLLEQAKKEPFKGVSVFQKFFGKHWDMIGRIAVDPAHEMHNLVRDMLGLLLSEGAMDFKKKRLDEEKKMSRFKNLKKPKDAGWIISAKRKAILDNLIARHELKVPEAWPRIINYFNEDFIKIKLAESMAFCGDRGAYFIGLTDVAPALRNNFIELLKVTGGFIAKTSAKANLKKLNNRLLVVLAELEKALPIYWNTSTRHLLLHMYETILSLGHFWSISMLGVERLHVLIKHLGTNISIYIYIYLSVI